MSLESPKINGDGSVSRDFTYVDNVIQANHLSALVGDKSALNQVYNIAHGQRTTLNQLFYMIRDKASRFNPKIFNIEPVYGPFRAVIYLIHCICRKG